MDISEWSTLYERDLTFKSSVVADKWKNIGEKKKKKIMYGEFSNSAWIQSLQDGSWKTSSLYQMHSLLICVLQMINFMKYLTVK